MEDELIASGELRLPGGTPLLQPEPELIISVVDVVDHPIERPQKNSVPATQVSAGDIP